MSNRIGYRIRIPPEAFPEYIYCYITENVHRSGKAMQRIVVRGIRTRDFELSNSTIAVTERTELSEKRMLNCIGYRVLMLAVYRVPVPPSKAANSAVEGPSGADVCFAV